MGCIVADLSVELLKHLSRCSAYPFALLVVSHDSGNVPDTLVIHYHQLLEQHLVQAIRASSDVGVPLFRQRTEHIPGQRSRRIETQQYISLLAKRRDEGHLIPPVLCKIDILRRCLDGFDNHTKPCLHSGGNRYGSGIGESF